ncbi:hypothetical protein V6N13_059843 [Hibiscus sabdariffa]
MLFGSGSTFAIAYVTAIVCAIIAVKPTQHIVYYRTKEASSFVVSILPTFSYSIVPTKQAFAPSVRCLYPPMLGNKHLKFSTKLLYYNNIILLQLNAHLNKGLNFVSGLALGKGFSYVIRRSNGTVVCWGSINDTA